MRAAIVSKAKKEKQGKANLTPDLPKPFRGIPFVNPSPFRKFQGPLSEWIDNVIKRDVTFHVS